MNRTVTTALIRKFNVNRKIHTTTATLFNSNPGAGEVTREVEITVGDTYVTIQPSIGSILAGKHLKIGQKAEVRLLFFHRERYFARGRLPFAIV